ncbi:MAG TPA: hypothetical protein VGB73_16265 [Pyrinomonadaceae bacterium]|jgi:chromosome segregation ATPase
MSSDNPTQPQNDPRSFEERIFARFDALDTRFDRFEARLDNVEKRLDALEAKQYDTKPMWERALAEIAEVRQQISAVNHRISVIDETLEQMNIRMDRTQAMVFEMRADLREFFRHFKEHA